MAFGYSRQFVYYRCIIKVQLINIGNKMKDKNEVSQHLQNNQPVKLDDFRNLKAWQDGSLINTDAIENLTIDELNRVAKILEGVK